MKKEGNAKNIRLKRNIKTESFVCKSVKSSLASKFMKLTTQMLILAVRSQKATQPVDLLYFYVLLVILIVVHEEEHPQYG